jgi:hypothetical protein
MANRALDPYASKCHIHTLRGATGWGNSVMKNTGSLFHVPLLLVIAALASADTSVGAKVNGIEVGKSAPAPAQEAAPTRAACILHCDSADTKCNLEVRHARMDCQRRASTGGRDPFTGRGDNGYFCGYFNSSSRCGPTTTSRGCQDRYARTYGLCVDRMQNNIAMMRYDCYTNERDAQTFCRDELQACKSTCGPP